MVGVPDKIRRLSKEMKNAKWLVFEECDAPLAVKEFQAGSIRSVVIAICGLGFFELYINGKKVSEDVLNPVWSDYEPRLDRRMLYPIQDTFTHRIYYKEYQVTDFLQEGHNRIEVLLGNGWYNQHERNVEGDFRYGDPKLCFSLKLYDKEDQMTEVVSDETMVWKRSVIVFNNVYMGEHHDFRMKDNHEYHPCKVCEAPGGELCLQTCPPDKKIRTIKPQLIHRDGERAVYDVGENISGHVRFVQEGTVGSKTTVHFAENINSDMSLNYDSAGGTEQIQTDECISDGSCNCFEPKFTWHGFRYFEIVGNAKDVEAVVVHSDVAVTSSFESDSVVLNWLYDSYIRTQLDNMHCGVVSDCPHRERLGYTGDGQLCCDAGMLLLDSKGIYEKWMRDIGDCQDIENGHIQHTAPFYGGGGGPGGWGCAIVAVPYFYYKHFGDKAVIEEYLPKMQKWVSYMESRSEAGIVVREEEGGWCLGDWCTPGKVLIKESFVNTYYLIKSLEMMIELAVAVGQDTAQLHCKKESLQAAFKQTFYDEKTNSYCDGVQGANAFAIDIGLGNDEMLSALVRHYDALGEFDTGIFGTDIVLRALFENGYEDVAFKLLTSEKDNSFGYQRGKGATTIWESWNGEASHNHPMFGACSRYLFTYLLGVQQKRTSAAHREFMIAPKIPKMLRRARGCVKLAAGNVSVSWSREAERIRFEILLPEQTECDFVYASEKRRLHGGSNIFEV